VIDSGCSIELVHTLRASDEHARGEPYKQAMLDYSDDAVQLPLKCAGGFNGPERAVEYEIPAIGDERRTIRPQAERGSGL
jgi:hypothetical protein